MSIDPADFASLTIEEQIRLAGDWHRYVRPTLVELAIENGMPRSLVEYHDEGGPAHFSFLENVQTSRVGIEDAIAAHFRNLPEYDLGPIFRPWFSAEALAMIEPKRISREEFYGTCFDARTGQLSPRCASGRPGTGIAGEFGHAFAHPPHGISFGHEKLQAIFEEMDARIFPQHGEFEILEWADETLGNVSNYFDAGLEWWGAFLFSISVPDENRLTIISASTTD